MKTKTSKAVESIKPLVFITTAMAIGLMVAILTC